MLYAKKNVTKAIHYCTLLSVARHFDARNHNTSRIKQAVKLNGFASKQYRCTAPLMLQKLSSSK